MAFNVNASLTAVTQLHVFVHWKPVIPQDTSACTKWCKHSYSVWRYLLYVVVLIPAITVYTVSATNPDRLTIWRLHRGHYNNLYSGFACNCTAIKHTPQLRTMQRTVRDMFYHCKHTARAIALPVKWNIVIIHWGKSWSWSTLTSPKLNQVWVTGVWRFLHRHTRNRRLK